MGWIFGRKSLHSLSHCVVPSSDAPCLLVPRGQSPGCWAEQLTEEGIFDTPRCLGLSAVLMPQDLASCLSPSSLNRKLSHIHPERPQT